MKSSSTLAFVNPVMAGLLATIGVGGSVGLGTVWMRHQVSVVADNNAALVRQLGEVERQISETNALVEEAMNPDVLRRQNARLQLGLVEMTQQQVLNTPNEVVGLLVARANQRLLARESGIAIRVPLASGAPATSAPASLSSVSAAAAPSATPLVPPLQLQFALSH